MPLVEVRDLTVRFVSRDLDIPVVNGVSFQLARGEVLCLLGESGSGKSVTMRALMRLFPSTARIGGSVLVDGHDILALPERGLRQIRGRLISMIFQEPMTAFDPVFTIGTQIAESVACHDRLSMRAARLRALELLELVQIPSARRRLDAYPHELSGGLRQRAMIALALACRPKLLLADEPTTALDATVQIQILLLLRELQRELGIATIFVTHDLGVACEVADRIAVMYAGRFVESGTAEEVMDTPRHPYTEGLLRSTVHAGMKDRRLDVIPGSPPDLAALPRGCAFAPRCGSVGADCLRAPPSNVRLGGSHEACCIRLT
ncbi:MAG TPA: ABC transporter ATP-binding protein [Aliidongia sp.]|uniref:ABC transporter ATP-binding protein n=1 Tax=Aliidongia sp. TaxID=1914230 RepID=UPI002DDD742F|nr:ABC transporter ATP-binding protein [Aliidongia sp.]HEV2673028.1 ABC transporter ATP-binding protein [Aliidongia sp.]